MGATIIPFPQERVHQPEPPTCLDCDHVTAGNRGLYCTFFKEFIVSESVAQECGEFKEI